MKQTLQYNPHNSFGPKEHPHGNKRISQSKAVAHPLH